MGVYNENCEIRNKNDIGRNFQDEKTFSLKTYFQQLLMEILLNERLRSHEQKN